MLDVAFYDGDFNETLISDVRVKEEEVGDIIYRGTFDRLPKAIFINANNKGYCRVILDESSV